MSRSKSMEVVVEGGCGGLWKLQVNCVCPGILSGECDVVRSGLGEEL